MNEAILVALLSFLGTAVGSVASIIASMKVTNVKLENLQKEVSKHNNVIERTFKLEEHAAVIDVRLGDAERRIISLENGGANG